MRVDLIGFNGNATHERTKKQFDNNQVYVQSQSFHGMLQECLGKQEVIDDAEERNSVAIKMLEANCMPRLVRH